MLAKIEQVADGAVRVSTRIFITTTGLWGCSVLVTVQHPQIMKLSFLACLWIVTAIHALAWMINDMIKET